MNFQNKNFQNIENKYTKTSVYLSKKLQSTILKILLICGIYITILISSALLGTVTGVIDNAPNISNINLTPHNLLTTIYDKDGNEIQRLVASGSNRIFVPIEKIPKYVQGAFIAIEDKRFRQHNGIDPEGIARAFVKGLLKGNFHQGASTITQQLLKNLVFNGGEEENFLQKVKRKLQEQFLAVEVEKEISKDKILESYLNTINFGYNTLGIELAANRYFNKSVDKLTLSEAAVLAAIPQSPSYLNPIDGQERNKERRTNVLNSMLENQLITQDEYNEAMADDVYANISLQYNDADYYTHDSYFNDALIEQLTEDLMLNLHLSKKEALNKIYSGGLKIYSTQDSNIQKISDEVLNSDVIPVDGYTLSYRLTIKDSEDETVNISEQSILRYLREKNNDPTYSIYLYDEDEAREIIDEYKSQLGEYSEIDEKVVLIPQPQVAFSVMDSHSGEVRAIVGGRGETATSSSLNRATNVYRQPGSTIKPLLDYAPGFDRNVFNKNTTFVDEPYSYPGGGPAISTPWGRWFGNVDMITAVCVSLNVPAVKALEQVGVSNALPYLKKMNFDHVLYTENEAGQSDVNLSVALGGFTYGVSNIQLTSAYATLANSGMYNKPRYYTKVTDVDGNVILENVQQTKQVYKRSTAVDMTDVLIHSPEVYVRSVYGPFANYGMEIACKTGTTNNDKDILLCGYSNYYTASIWLGYDNFNKGISHRNQIKAWDMIMRQVHNGLEPKKVYGN